ncbi:NAD(P)H-dependent glycerol-3-phosphate dehydrogenase [Shigella sonnei]|nr:NAD(P)H-dependent glycerol-3-phosphate dehydrogenase [Shigella sonnei]
MQLGGAVKNVIAIGAGMSDGIGFGANARTALITRGLAEMSRLGAALGADPATFMGMAGLGELAHRFGVEMPITEEIYQVLYCGKNAREAALTLLGRARKDERSSH